MGVEKKWPFCKTLKMTNMRHRMKDDVLELSALQSRFEYGREQTKYCTGIFFLAESLIGF